MLEEDEIREDDTEAMRDAGPEKGETKTKVKRTVFQDKSINGTARGDTVVAVVET